jgi:hypothetical protein
MIINDGTRSINKIKYKTLENWLRRRRLEVRGNGGKD